MKKTVLTILQNYPLSAVKKIQPIAIGWVNKNFYITTDQGDYVLQRLAPVFDERTIEDIALVVAHLNNKKVPTLKLTKTKRGGWHHKHDGHLWKLMQAIKGETHEEIRSDKMAYEAGRALGEFIQGMKDFNSKQLKNPLRLHQTAQVYAAYLKIYSQLTEQEKNTALLSCFSYIKEQLPQMMLPESLPQSIVHGDPKISNIIFQGEHACCMIDLDTCMLHTPLVDIGDAMWSWCGQAEDCLENTFSLSRFKEALRGLTLSLELSADEKKYIYQALQMITLELASRFAKDIVEDAYFGWNQNKYSSRSQHNQARVRSLVHLSLDMCAKKEAIEKIVFPQN